MNEMDEMPYLARGSWTRGQLSTRLVPSTLVLDEGQRRQVEAAWTTACATPGRNLFDGPLCRLEGLTSSAGHLHLDVSVTSYKWFYGTNGEHPEWPQRADGVGTSAVLLTGDGWLLFGRRAASLAFYPGWAHPFGGCLEPAADIDLLTEMERELTEEIGLRPEEIDDLRCVGLVRTPKLQQPELLYLAPTRLTRAELEGRLDHHEHSACWGVRAEAASLDAALRADDLTPVTRAVLRRYRELLV